MSDDELKRQKDDGAVAQMAGRKALATEVSVKRSATVM